MWEVKLQKSFAEQEGVRLIGIEESWVQEGFLVY